MEAPQPGEDCLLFPRGLGEGPWEGCCAVSPRKPWGASWGRSLGLPHSTASLHSSGVAAAAAAAAGTSTWCSTSVSLAAEMTRAAHCPAGPCTGVSAVSSCVDGTKAFDWHTGENFLPLSSQGEARRGPCQGACLPAATAEGSFSGTTFKVVASRTR